MEITEVRIFPRESKDKKLKAYATVTFDNSFVVRDIKIIKGNKGFFVAMPSRRLRENCPKCGHRNIVRSKYCNQCGSSLPASEVPPQSKEARQSEYRDIAHPINSQFRDYFQRVVMEKYKQEVGEDVQEESKMAENKPQQDISSESEGSSSPEGKNN